MDIGAVRQGLADAVKAADITIPGMPKITTYGYFPNSLTPPTFYVGEVEIDFLGAMSRGLDILEVTCRALIGRAEDRSSQSALDKLLSGSGPTSLIAAINGVIGVKQDLHGACDDAMVVRVQGYRQYDHRGAHFVGAEIIVKVVGSGA